MTKPELAAVSVHRGSSRNNRQRMANVVLVAIDASPQAEKAFDWYMEHIHKPGNCIVILHCMDLSAVTMADDYDDRSSAKIWEAKKTKYKELESKYRWKLNELGLPGKIRTESGKPGEVVISVANQEKANLIVIGSRCLSRLQRTISGSVSDYVLHNAKCSVIICRQSENSPTEEQQAVKA